MKIQPLRRAFTIAGIALAAAAIATDNRAVAWASIVVLAVVLFLRSAARRELRGGPPDTGAPADPSEDE